MISMLGLRRSSLWLRLAWPFLLFVVVGSVGLAFWIQRGAMGRSHAVFAALAQTNAEFFRDRRLSLSERMADDVSRMLNVRAIIRRGTELLPEPDGFLARHRETLRALRGDEGVVTLGDGFEAIAAPMAGDDALLLVQKADSTWAFLAERETILVLAIFWGLSIGLAWAVTRNVVRPLRLLAARLPQIGHDSGEALPGMEREDEIGQLARAYMATRSQLAEERTRREQSERLAILGRVATGLAHEIHNPLSAMRMHAQLIDSAPAGEVEGTARDSIPVVLGEVTKIEGLVNQWMFLARPEPPETSTIDLAEAVAKTVRTYAALAAHAEVEICQAVPRGLMVSADVRRLAQAVSNVVVNAVQAMPAGGRLLIAGEPSNDECTLSFHDGGRGFSSAALSRYAELFYSEKEGGMGIGLNVTAEILKAHGGCLEAANSPEGGAIVTFHLPCA